MANPSNFNIEQTKKANTPFQNDITVNQVQSSTGTITDPAFTPYYTKIVNKRYNGTATSAAMMANVTCYSQSYYRTENNTNEFSIYTNKNRSSSSMLTVIQITPYQNTNTNTLRLMYTIRLLSSWVESTLDTYQLITEQYISQDNYWNKYVNISQTAYYFNYDAIQDITNSQLGFTYTSDIIMQQITESTTDQTKTITGYLNLDPNKTNYVYLYTYMLYEPPQGSQATSNSASINGNELIAPKYQAWTVRIEGEIIPSITNYEVIDIPGIMWEVLTMPFTFISIAFNLTIFPNTPYQVNLSNLFLSIIGIIIFAFILSKFIKKV